MKGLKATGWIMRPLIGGLSLRIQNERSTQGMSGRRPPIPYKKVDALLLLIALI
jgi:hypothetical protein